MPRLCIITLALMLSGMMGMAAANIQMTPKHLGIGVHVDTIARIPEHHPRVAGKYVQTIKPPRVGSKWGCEEKMQKVRGREPYVVAVMDLYTRFILAWGMSSPTKEKYDAAPLPRAARDVAGRIPPAVYHRRPGPVPHRLQEGVLYAEGPQVRPHTRHPHPEPHMQHQQAGAPQRWVRWPLQVYTRGINKEESLIFRMAILHYNYIKPHGGLGGRTPAGAAGIHIRGTGRWLTLIQNAVSAA